MKRPENAAPRQAFPSVVVSRCRRHERGGTFVFLHRGGSDFIVVALMISLPTVLLRPGEADRVIAGHPWIYDGAVLRLTAPAVDGELVQVKDHRQRLLGIGFYNSKS